jgi:hypothetical protein
MFLSVGSLSLLCTVACIVHCIKTQQNTTWIWVLAALFWFPFIGSLVYFCANILPGLLGSRSGRRAVRGLRDTLNPEGDLRRLENDVKVTGDVGSRQRYADELVRLGRAPEAVEVYKSCLTGLFADDPKLLLGYARSLFAAGDAAGARRTLDDLIRKNPDFKSADGHLLYARALESEGDFEKALSEYATLAGYFPGAEASVRYAKLLKRQGQDGQARQVLEGLLDRAKYAPSHYKRAQREWLDEAAAELRG